MPLYPLHQTQPFQQYLLYLKKTPATYFPWTLFGNVQILRGYLGQEDIYPWWNVDTAKKFPSHHTYMLHHVLKIPHSLAPCEGMRYLSHISFDEFIWLFSFNNITGKIHTEFHMQCLKLYTDTKAKTGTFFRLHVIKCCACLNLNQMPYHLLHNQKSHIWASMLVWRVFAKQIFNIQIIQYLRWLFVIFFIVRTYLIVLLNWFVLNNFLIRLGVLEVISDS